MEGLADVAVALLEGDPRLSAHSGDGLVTTGDDHVCLLRELLTALVPECLNFVTASLLPEESQDSLPLTCEHHKFSLLQIVFCIDILTYELV